LGVRQAEHHARFGSAAGTLAQREAVAGVGHERKPPAEAGPWRWQAGSTAIIGHQHAELLAGHLSAHAHLPGSILIGVQHGVGDGLRYRQAHRIQPFAGEAESFGVRGHSAAQARDGLRHGGLRLVEVRVCCDQRVMWSAPWLVAGFVIPWRAGWPTLRFG
jgi:hypothetical protein